MDMKDMTSDLVKSTQQGTSSLHAVLNTLVDAAIVIDKAGTIHLVNPSGEQIFGYSADEMMGQNVTLLMPEPYRSEHDDYVGAYVETGEAKIIGIGREVEGRRKSGEVFPMHLAVGEMGRNGSTLFIGIIRDLTAKREREAEFEALQARHFHLSRVAAMNEMGTAIAHEINQPLAATANYVETARILADKLLAEHPNADDRLPSVLARALEQNNRAAEIIARMRTFIERGDIDPVTLDLSDIIEESLMLTLSRFRDDAVQLVRDIQPDAVFVRGDAVHIQQVLVNLIRNGCEAMSESGPRRLTLRVALDAEHADMARISVSDTGLGLSEEALPELFTAFSSTKTGGLGVGLSISQSIVRAHGGRIWASDNTAGGATFSFTLPLATRS